VCTRTRHGALQPADWLGHAAPYQDFGWVIVARRDLTLAVPAGDRRYLALDWV
jgi:hypothetical protein